MSTQALTTGALLVEITRKGQAFRKLVEELALECRRAENQALDYVPGEALRAIDAICEAEAATSQLLKRIRTKGKKGSVNEHV